MALALDQSGLKMVAKQLSNLEQATGEERAAEREAADLLRIIAVAVGCMAIIAILIALNLAKMVAMPITAGIVAGLIIGPVGDRAKAWGIPASAAFSLVSLTIAGVVYGIVRILWPSVTYAIDNIPAISHRLQELSWKMDSWLNVVKDIRATNLQPSQAVAAGAPTSAVEVATKALEIVTPAVSQFFIFVFALILFFASRNEIRKSFVMRGKSREKRLTALKTFSNVEIQLNKYFVTITMINAGLATAVGTVFFIAGVPGAATWAVLAFLLNYLPVVGPLIMKASLIGYGILFAPNFVEGALPLAAYLAISLIEANVVTPKIVGDRITMNPLMVFISVVFWTWMWGFAGALLAMPLLAIASAVRENYFTNHNSKTLPV